MNQRRLHHVAEIQHARHPAWIIGIDQHVVRVEIIVHDLGAKPRLPWPNMVRVAIQPRDRQRSASLILDEGQKPLKPGRAVQVPKQVVGRGLVPEILQGEANRGQQASQFDRLGKRRTGPVPAALPAGRSAAGSGGAIRHSGAQRSRTARPAPDRRGEPATPDHASARWRSAMV